MAKTRVSRLSIVPRILKSAVTIGAIPACVANLDACSTTPPPPVVAYMGNPPGPVVAAQVPAPLDTAADAGAPDAGPQDAGVPIQRFHPVVAQMVTPPVVAAQMPPPKKKP